MHISTEISRKWLETGQELLLPSSEQYYMVFLIRIICKFDSIFNSSQSSRTYPFRQYLQNDDGYGKHCHGAITYEILCALLIFVFTLTLAHH